MKKLNNLGFSLVEVVVATVILGLLIVSVSALYYSIDSAQRRAQELEAATRAAELQLESLRNMHYNSLVAGETIDFTDDLPAILREPRSATVTVSAPEPDLRRLEVIITYRDGLNERSVQLSALIGSIGIAQ